MSNVPVERVEPPAPEALEGPDEAVHEVGQARASDLRFIPGVKRGPITPAGKKP
ncbi:MAG: hypothetical protein Q8L14_34600 [Myxococcales bacterium]|nr:hypothetical protein [Myxococcales bacterium]